MRKTILFAGIAALMAYACSVMPEIGFDEPDVPTYTFRLNATIDDELTRTAYGNDKIFSWSADDQISVLFHKGNDNKFFTLTNTTGAGSSATFSGEIESGYELCSSNGEKIALFPAGDHYYDRTKAKYDAASYPKRGAFFNIPALTDFTKTHFSANLPMAAMGDGDNNFAFKHISGSYKVVFTNIDQSVSKVKLHVKNQKTRALSGDLRLEDGGSHIYCWWWTYAAEGSSAQTVSYVVNVVDGKATFYIPYSNGDGEGFQPTLTLTNAADGNTLISVSAKAPFSGDNKPSYHHLVVLPEIPVTGTGSNQPTAVSPLNLSFKEASGEVTNPERGMMSYNKFNLTAAGPYSTSKIPQDYTGESLAFLLFYLSYYIDKDLDANITNLVKAELDKVRAANKKAVLRFAYSETYDKTKPQEATPTRILAHIDQLESTLAENADIIYLVQAGWLGTYGEWYYKTNNHDNSVSAYTDYYYYAVNGKAVTDLNNNHKNLIDKVLLKVPSPIQIGLRTAFYKRYYLSPSDINAWSSISSWGTGANDRLAFYNDGFRGSSSDVGTFKSQTDRDMWYSQGNWLACGGELSYKSEADFALVSDELKDCDNSITELKRQHWSYLHYSTSNRFMKIWYDAGRFEDIKKALGYRLVLNSVNLSFPNLNSGTSVSYNISIQNKGCAPVIYSRPFKLVLLHDGVATSVVENLMDVRNLVPGAAEPTVLNGSFTLPYSLSVGDQLAIWLPDADILDNGLDEIPAYSIRLANSDVTWDNGFNVLYTF